MHVLSAVFIDGARMLSRGSIVDALQGTPALIKERMKLNPHTMERFRSKTHHFAYRLHSNVSKGKKNGTVSCMEKSENGGFSESECIFMYLLY